MSQMSTAAANTGSAIARGVLQEVVAPSATRPGHIVLAVPGTSYQIHLRPAGPITATPGKRIAGTIRGECRRCDKVDSGGRFVEPVFGRPRRVQGTVIAQDAGARTLTVDAGGAAIPGVEWGLPIVVKLSDARQTPADYAIGQMVTFEVLDGATFTQA
ncbi:MAG: hypothetical protein K1X57_20430 [Gemmataceae bacterium]|nr:hypothetical protein [Gemmataceae bacterium]